MTPANWSIGKHFHMTPDRWLLWRSMLQPWIEVLGDVPKDARYAFLWNTDMKGLGRSEKSYTIAMLSLACKWRELVGPLYRMELLPRPKTWRMYNCPPPDRVFVPESRDGPIRPCMSRICPFCTARATIKVTESLSPASKGKRIFLSAGTRFIDTPSRDNLKTFRVQAATACRAHTDVPLAFQFLVGLRDGGWRADIRAISDVCDRPDD